MCIQNFPPFLKDFLQIPLFERFGERWIIFNNHLIYIPEIGISMCPKLVKFFNWNMFSNFKLIFISRWVQDRIKQLVFTFLKLIKHFQNLNSKINTNWFERKVSFPLPKTDFSFGHCSHKSISSRIILFDKIFIFF